MVLFVLDEPYPDEIASHITDGGGDQINVIVLLKSSLFESSRPMLNHLPTQF